MRRADSVVETTMFWQPVGHFSFKCLLAGLPGDPLTTLGSPLRGPLHAVRGLVPVHRHRLADVDEVAVLLPHRIQAEQADSPVTGFNQPLAL